VGVAAHRSRSDPPDRGTRTATRSRTSASTGGRQTATTSSASARSRAACYSPTRRPTPAAVGGHPDAGRQRPAPADPVDRGDPADGRRDDPGDTPSISATKPVSDLQAPRADPSARGLGR